MKQIEQILRETIGLDAASIGSSMIERAVRLRMKNRNVRKRGDYQQLLEASESEWRELIEAVVVTETWFFRDVQPFTALAQLISEQWLPEHSIGKAKILSLPCSSGEEPYSVAMALLDAGVSSERFDIDGVDISDRAVARAERGTFRRNSFRGKQLGFRDRYFQAIREGYLLDPLVRKCVRFRVGNLLREDFRAPQPVYDYIFCRNLLIYFDGPTQQKALRIIANLLVPGGMLFVGPAEQPLALANGFISAEIPLAFACYKDRPASSHQNTPSATRREGRPFSTAATRPTNGAPQVSCRDQLDSVSPAPKGRVDLHDARRLADAGRLSEAAEICEMHLREKGASAEAYYLLGLVRDASGAAGAAECFRKALYLDPDHYESLLHLAFWWEKNGQPTRARAFRNRAQRAKLKNSN